MILPPNSYKYVDSKGSVRWKKEGLHNRLSRQNLGNAVVVNSQPSHNRFPMDGVVVGAC